ncbi:single-stranded DNA-binding protein [Spirulina subsalsa FACHB-351]|uniref:Single-stranded DNA-binding protein n=1 Tax=Spirulina subsalsa FACHB-351 TaxID=234711 RepID=A0ABT3L9F3_9CYAN|nr:single-stranded DNA-binding protein [Spirulina subsalsa]MCW6038129.1 single-stranded DNA-binding protein [Spirulina subsalsa FACHB-351]
MNTCILMARIVQAPELRYTQDNQTPVASMIVEFEGGREEDPPMTLKAVGWGNLATDIQESYQVGDRVILQGSLRMNTIDRPEGYKEKRAELSVSRIYKQDGTFSPTLTSQSTSEASPRPSNVVPLNYNKAPNPAPVAPPPEPVTVPSGFSSSDNEPDLDDIPF